MIAKLGNTEYRRCEISKKGKEMFADFEELKEDLDWATDHILHIDYVRDKNDFEKVRAQLKLIILNSLKRSKEALDDLMDKVIDEDISELQEVLDELDDRDSNLFN